RDRDLHARRPHAPRRPHGQRRAAARRRRAMDDCGPRRDPQRNAGAGRRRDARLPAVAQPARQIEDGRCRLRRHPAGTHPTHHHAERRRRGRHRRAVRRRSDTTGRRGAASGHRAAV
nr:hypothetical protein [Tanacetum cinerariifolium]